MDFSLYFDYWNCRLGRGVGFRFVRVLDDSLVALCSGSASISGRTADVSCLRLLESDPDPELCGTERLYDPGHDDRITFWA